MKPSEIIRDAIDLIKKHGWTMGDWKDANGCVCIEGALLEAGERHSLNKYKPEPGPTMDAFIALRKDLEVRDLYYFNDIEADTIARRTGSHPRTVVLRKMGQTARRLEREGR